MLPVLANGLWWHRPRFPTLIAPGKLRQRALKFEAYTGDIVSPRLAQAEKAQGKHSVFTVTSQREGKV